MASGFKGALGALIAGSLMVSSTVAVAASSAAPAAPISAKQIDPWVALSAMSGQASAQALCGGSSLNGCQLAQGGPPPTPQSGPPPQPIPVPPVDAPNGGLGLGIDPLLLVLGLLALGGLIFLLVHNKNNNSNSPA